MSLAVRRSKFCDQQRHSTHAELGLPIACFVVFEVSHGFGVSGVPQLLGESVAGTGEAGAWICRKRPGSG